MEDREPAVIAIERSLRSLAAGKPPARTSRVSRASTVVIVPEDSSLLAYDYLGNLVSDALRPADLAVLRVAARWQSPAALVKRPQLAGTPLALLAKRRTRRSFDGKPITVEELGDCLYAGLGITGFVVDAVPNYGKLPMRLSPSGGARNPYEAYVMANRVTGLAPGFYHYSAFEHSLGQVTTAPLPVPSEILGGQEWYDRAPAIVFLAASYKRSQWKYKHPMVFRAVLIEAGHIAQNIMLAVFVFGLSCSPTGLCADRTLEDLLGLDHVMQGIPYVIGIGHTRKTGVDWGTFEPHP